MTDVNPYASLHVSTVINAAGKMTAMGGSAQSAGVAEAQALASRAHVDLSELRRTAGRRVAGMCGAQAGCITSGAAAGICISVAAVVTGGDAERIAQLPDVADGPREVLLQSGHDVNFGASVVQMVRMGGGQPLIIGTARAVTVDDMRLAIGPSAACLLFVQSHHCAQEGRLTLEQMCVLAESAGVPLIVDAAAEGDMQRYVAAGAELVTYSGGKAIGGPTTGFIVGRSDLIEACEQQSSGIARPMKVGKEQIMGLMTALDEYRSNLESDTGSDTESNDVLNALVTALEPLSGIRVNRVPDRAGRPIERAGIRVIDGRFDLQDLVSHLHQGNPSIRTRNHQLGEGLMLLDPRELSAEDVPFIADRIAQFCAGLDG